MLGAHRVVTRGEGDCDVAKSKHGSIEADFRAWKTKFLARLQALQKGEKKPCDGNCKRGQCESSAVRSPCPGLAAFLLCVGMLDLTTAPGNSFPGWWLGGRSVAPVVVV